MWDDEMMQPFYDHESDMKISFAQLVGFLDFTTSGLLMSALDSSSNRRDRTKNSNQWSGLTGSMGAMAMGGLDPSSRTITSHCSL